jgi:HEAT repeat protein
LLTSDFIGVRLSAIEGLGGIGPDAKQAVPALVEALNDRGQGTFHTVRQKAAWALGRIGPAASDAIEPLLALVTSDDTLDRLDGTVAVWRIDPTKAAALPLLIESLRAKPYIQVRAIETLKEIGPPAAPALPALRDVLERVEEGLRPRVEQAIRAIESPT